MANSRTRKKIPTPPIKKYTFKTADVECTLEFVQGRWTMTVNGNTPKARYSRPESCIEELVENGGLVAWGVEESVINTIPLELAAWKYEK